MSKLIPYLKSVKTLPGLQLSVEFEDGVSGVVDLSVWKGKGVFKFWDKEENFQGVKITSDKKLQWSEEIDMDPDAFYLQLIGKSFEEYASNKQLLRHSH